MFSLPKMPPLPPLSLVHSWLLTSSTFHRAITSDNSPLPPKPGHLLNRGLHRSSFFLQGPSQLRHYLFMCGLISVGHSHFSYATWSLFPLSLSLCYWFPLLPSPPTLPFPSLQATSPLFFSFFLFSLLFSLPQS